MLKKNHAKCVVSCVIDYANLNEPKPYKNDVPKYSGRLIVSKSDKKSLKKIELAMQEAYESGISTLQGDSRTVPDFKEITSSGPLYDGDKSGQRDPVYKGSFYLNAKNLHKPRIVNADKELIVDPGELYSGIHAKCFIGFFAYNKAGNRGIGVILERVMKIKDGRPLGLDLSMDDVFDEDDDEDDVFDDDASNDDTSNDDASNDDYDFLS